MRGVYNLYLVNQTVAAVILAFINPNTKASIGIKRMWSSQRGVTASAQQPVEWFTQVSVFPTMSASTAPVKTARADAASSIVGGGAGAAGTSGTLSTAAGGGTVTAMGDDTFNVLTGHLWTPTPDEVIELSAGIAEGFGYQFTVAPGTTAGWTGGFTFQEHG